LSSAILYLAIIAIWAGVLIPRWLRRDTSQAKKSKLAREVPADGDADSGEAGVQMADDAGRGERDDDPADSDFAGYEQDGHTEARRRILAARRRMLRILLTLTGVAGGIVAVGLAAWWVAVPPILMLGGYLLLLREASRADAERARLLADGAAWREEQRRLRQAEREAAARLAEERIARIIDISERMRDEFYDQYADTERRAVGD